MAARFISNSSGGAKLLRSYAAGRREEMNFPAQGMRIFGLPGHVKFFWRGRHPERSRSSGEAKDLSIHRSVGVRFLAPLVKTRVFGMTPPEFQTEPPPELIFSRLRLPEPSPNSRSPAANGSGTSFLRPRSNQTPPIRSAIAESGRSAPVQCHCLLSWW